jgi:transposase
MKQILIAGVDVSKSTLDVFFKPCGYGVKRSNDNKGFNQLLKELKLIKASTPLVVMEHTGRYSLKFETFLRTHGIGYCKLSALQIKRSLGVIRGKSDKVDAERIAEYGWLRRDELQCDIALSDKLVQLQEVLSLRLKLVRDRSGYINRFKELQSSGCCTKTDQLGKVHLQAIAFFTKQILELEARMKMLVKSDEKLYKDCSLLTSIKGIGWIIACYMICKTKDFTSFASARKFNCYAGIAPFVHQSGSSIKGRSRVSHLANKKAKTLLNLAASSAIQHDPELKAYYQRKIAEGKKRMCCLNSVRAKLVARMFAVIKRQSPYQTRLAA